MEGVSALQTERYRWRISKDIMADLQTDAHKVYTMPLRECRAKRSLKVKHRRQFEYVNVVHLHGRE